MKRFFVLWGGAALLVSSLPATAAPARAASIGLSTMDFGYKEFDTDGTLLDREDGWLPGVSVGLVETRARWYGELQAAVYGGGVTYKGQVQSRDPTVDGQPIRSDTDQIVADGSFQLGHWFGPAARPRWAAYGGVGYRYWSRDIQAGRLPDGTPVSGLLEHYRWWYALAGVKVNLLQQARSLVQADLRFTRTLGPTMDVDFRGYQGLDNAQLDLGERTGYRLALPWRVRAGVRSEISLVPFYEAWDIGRSAPEVATGGGVPQGIVVEPRSETRNWGLSVNYRRSF